MMLGRKLAAVCFGCALLVTPAIVFADGPSSLELQFRNHLLSVQGAASGQEAAGAAGGQAGFFATGSFAQISAAVLAAAALAVAISALTGGDSGTTTTTSSSTSTSTSTVTATTTYTGNDIPCCGGNQW